jgi:glucose/arabinose dehydrogenase
MQAHRAPAILVVAIVALSAFVAAPQLAAAADNTVLPPGFEETNLGENGFLSKPTHVVFAPDGRVFVVDERYADVGPPQIKVKVPGSSQYKPLFTLDRVNIKQDRGITGMALDKDFGTSGNNYMYLLYTYEHTSETPGTSANARTQRLTRVTVPDAVPGSPEKPAETVLLGSVGTPVSTTQACPYPKTGGGAFDPNGSWAPYQNTDCIPSDATEHAVDSVVVDPTDGTLWVSIGDGAAGGDFADPLAFRAQAIDSLAGKLLHVDRNGKGLPGNGTCPAVTDFERNCTKVYARGLRNPFRFSFRPDGKIALGDPGWKTREEIDLISSGGKNYGWPCYEGSIQTPLWKDRPECVAFYAASTPHEPPIYEYLYPKDTFGAAVILGPTYLGVGQTSDYPDEYKGGLFFSDFVSSEVKYLKLDAAGLPVSGYPKPFGKVFEAVSWQLAPDGDLVYVDLGLGEVGGDSSPAIRKISAVDNFTPEAVIEIENGGLPYGDVPLEVDLDGSKSSDRDPGETATLDFAWDLDGDGQLDDSTAKDPSPRTYTDGTENVTVALRVTDIGGKSDTATLELQPGNNPPQKPSMDGGNPTTYRGGQEVQLAGSTSDPDGDFVTLRWSVMINHANTHTHEWAEDEGNVFSFETDAVHDQPSTYDVTVYAEDEPRGLKSQTVKLVLQPETQALHLTSNPPGAVVNHGGVDHLTPYTGSSTIGVQVGISASESFLFGGVAHVFEGWSNGGPRSQTLTMPAGGLSLNASYRAQPPSGGSGGGEGPGADDEPVLLRFDAKRGLVVARRSLLRGTARDPSGVRRVQVALRALAKRAGKCRWWSARLGGLAERGTSCAKPAYMGARLSGGGSEVRWTLPLGGRILPGRYLLVFRTVDGEGNVGRGPGGRAKVPLRVPAA